MDPKLEPKELIEKAKNGDKEAFGKLYKSFFVPVFRYIYLRIQNKEETADLTQNVFLKIYQSIDKYRDMGKEPLAYFFTVARNTVTDFWRKKKDISLDENLLALSEIPAQDDLMSMLAKDETAKTLKWAINQLADPQKEVIILKYLSDLSNSQIAEILDKNEAAVRQIQHRALQKLKQLLKGNI